MHSPQNSILWFCNIRAVKKKISIFDMYIPCEASSWTLLHQNRKLSSRISLQNQLFSLCRLPAVSLWFDPISARCGYCEWRQYVINIVYSMHVSFHNYKYFLFCSLCPRLSWHWCASKCYDCFQHIYGD